MLKIIHVERGLGKFIIGGHILWGAIEFPSIRKGMHVIESRGLLASWAGTSERMVARTRVMFLHRSSVLFAKLRLKHKTIYQTLTV